jgi:hypothetical protein
MSKKKKTLLGIFIEAIGLYFSNFDKFIKYMTFPVLGQFIGIALIIVLSYFYSQHIPSTENLSILVLLSIGVTLPGLILFTKALWEYLIAYGAVNSMLDNMLKSGRVYDFEAHTELIKRRTAAFVGLWFLVGMFSILSIIPFLWVPACVFFVYFILVFQVFTFEPEETPIGCVRKSLLLIKGHFVSTFTLVMLIGFLTYLIIPQTVNYICEILKINILLTQLITPLVEYLPINDINNFLGYLYLKPINAFNISSFIISSIIMQILVQYTLPLRSILWSMWYKELNNSSSTEKPKKYTRKTKPSEKLMEESHKKFGTKKLDRNILRRAMDKD